jgi:hypothetical protein
VFAAAGGENKGVELDLTVTASGGNGINLDLVNVSGYYGSFVNAIELDQAVAGGAVAPTANIQISTDNGATWAQLATNVPINRFGQGEYTWTVDRTTTGSTALIRVTSGSLTATSQPFLLANGGTSFYINDSSQLGDQYTTAVGNDANSGKSPSQPMASLAALLRAYPIGPGDTVYVDTGNYVATSDAVLATGDGGSASAPALIIGPTNGGTVVINRDNTSPGADVIDDTGGSYITIENLGMTGAYDGVDFSGTSTNVTLMNDSIYGNTVSGVVVANTLPPTVANLTIADSIIYGNKGAGLDLQDGLASGTLLDDQVYNNGSDGIDLYTLNGNGSIIGGAVYDNGQDGLRLTYDGTAEDVLVYGNGQDGIDASRYNNPVVISDNTVYANANAGLDISDGTVSGNLVYDQVNSGRSAIELRSGSTGTGNTVYGSSTGITDDGGSPVLDNVIYQASGSGIYLDGQTGYTITGNILYGDKNGISGSGNSITLENNLIYDNVSTGVTLSGGGTITIVNNTIYQSVGQALVLSGVSNVTVENNILWVDEGDIISVASGAQTGFLSAYNLYYQGADATPATLGIWLGTAETSLAAWQTASGQDTNGSKAGNPDFVNIAGADQILGGPGTPIGAGADDDFELKSGSPAIDAANAYIAPFADLLGQPRQDDPATVNAGVGYPLYVQGNGGASSLPATSGMTSLNLRSAGGVTTYTLPFSFSFYGKTYTSVLVSSQGYLQFAGSDTSGYDTPSLANLETGARIAPFWAQINTYTVTGSGVYVSSTASSVTFEWVASANTGGGAVNFAVTLNSNGTFSFAYGAGNASLSPIIGVSAGNSAIYGQTPVYVLSTASGSASLNNAAVQTWTPQAGDTYFDIGAFEFQGNSSDTTPPTVVSVSPLPANNGTTGLAFTGLTVTFSEALDLVSASSPANYSLIEADSNGNFNTSGATVIPVVPVYTVGATTVTLELPNGELAAGKYQLTLSGTRAIFDQSGNALAGNGTTAGTNYVQDFTIDRTGDQPPVATAQSVSAPENGTQQIVLAATDAQANPIAYSIVTQPGEGMLSAITNGNTLIYTPAPNYYGADSFVFQATDPDGKSSQATVSVTVTPVNTAPTAIPQSISVTHDAARTIVLSGTDAQTPASQLTYTITTQPAHGVLTPVAGSPGTFSYTPTAGYLGADSFAFTVTDTGNPPGTPANALTSAPATVSMSVVDPAPVGVPDSYTARENVSLSVSATQGVLADDTDSAGDTLTATLATNVTHGTLVLSSNGSFVYTPNTGYVGTDSFTYIPHGTYAAGTATTVTITVKAGVAPPPAPPGPPGPPGAPGGGLPGGTEGVGSVSNVTIVPSGTVGSTQSVTPATTPAVSSPPIVVPSAQDTPISLSGGVLTPAAVTPSASTTSTPTVSTTSSTTPTTISSSSGIVLLPSSSGTVTTAFDFDGDWIDSASLIASSDPIMLPNATMPGDELSSLVLPAAPEISQLPEALAAALKRFTHRTDALITFVDPVTGRLSDDDSQTDVVPDWLVIDTDAAMGPSQILWDNQAL